MENQNPIILKSTVVWVLIKSFMFLVGDNEYD